MINDTEEALRGVVEGMAQVINRLTNDPETLELLRLSIMAICAGSYKCGYEKGRLKGRAEYE